jgi:hypothetical protein
MLITPILPPSFVCNFACTRLVQGYIFPFNYTGFARAVNSNFQIAHFADCVNPRQQKSTFSPELVAFSLVMERHAALRKWCFFSICKLHILASKIFVCAICRRS